jgi:hypothetical protein
MLPKSGNHLSQNTMLNFEIDHAAFRSVRGVIW